MLTNKAVAFGWILPLLVGCGADASDENPTAPTAPAASSAQHPEWLAGSWTTTGEQAHQSEWTVFLTLNANGTGWRAYSRIVFNTVDNDGSEVTWAYGGENLVIDGISKPLAVAPNCTLIARDGLQFYRFTSGEPVRGCPFEVPPLSDEEQRLVGEWRVKDYDGVTSATLTLSVDRSLYLDTYVADRDTKRKVRGTWSYSGAKIRAINAAGDEVVDLGPVLTEKGLEVGPDSVMFAKQ
jgi:hypothetical protein